MHIWENSIPGQSNAKCKGSAVGEAHGLYLRGKVSHCRMGKRKRNEGSHFLFHTNKAVFLTWGPCGPLRGTQDSPRGGTGDHRVNGDQFKRPAEMQDHRQETRWKVNHSRNKVGKHHGSLWSRLKGLNPIAGMIGKVNEKSHQGNTVLLLPYIYIALSRFYKLHDAYHLKIWIWRGTCELPFLIAGNLNCWGSLTRRW